jgi:hypothetical protein
MIPRRIYTYIIYMHFNEFKIVNHNKHKITATSSESMELTVIHICNGIHDNIQA